MFGQASRRHIDGRIKPGDCYVFQHLLQFVVAEIADAGCSFQHEAIGI